MQRSSPIAPPGWPDGRPDSPMSLMPGLLSALLLAQVPATPSTLETLLRPSTLTRDADGTPNVVAGFRFDGGSRDAATAAQAFLRTHGTALGIHPLQHVSNVQKVGRRTVVRFHETFAGVPVRGAGVNVVVEDGVVTMAVRGKRILGAPRAFLIDAEHAAQVALQNAPMGTSPQVDVPALQKLARRVHIANADGTLTPAWAVRVDSVIAIETVEILVDAERGTLLSRTRLARTQVPTEARVYDPSPGENNERAATTVQLSSLKDPAPSPHLRGDFVDTFNCCKRYECVGADGGCDEKVCVSAGSTDGVEARQIIAFPTDSLPIPEQISQVCTIPNPVYLDTVACEELPKATSATNNNWVFDPIDVAMPMADALSSEEDDFAEVMAYYHLQKFHDHVRTISDEEFCLHSQECTAGVPSQAFHVSVNVQLPAFDQATLQELLCQVCAVPFLCPAGSGGKGTEANPATINKFQRLANAAFVPALDQSTLPIPIPGFARPYDSLMFFQGQRDFAYDGDVVYHEYTHAVIHSVVTDGNMPAGLNGFVRDAWGVHNDSGALNEAYADFFSQSFTHDAVTGEYAAKGLNQGEVGIRNAGERWTCPTHITGEVHDDSRPWSSALWAIRDALANGNDATTRRFEQAVFTAMAALPADSTFAQASSTTRAAVLAEFPGTEAQLDAALNDRGVADCERVRPLVRLVGDTVEVETVEVLQMAGKAEAGLTNHAPGHMQLRLDLPPRTNSFTLQFNARGGGIIGSITGQEPQDNSLVVVVKPDAPIVNTYSGNTAVRDSASIDQTVTPDDEGNITLPVEVALENGGTYYVGFNITADNGVTLSDITATLDVSPAPDAGHAHEADAGSTTSSQPGGGGDTNSPAAGPCQCLSGLPESGMPMLGLGLALLALLRRRR